MEHAKKSSKARTRLLLHRIDGRLEARLRLIRQSQAARGAPVAACEAEVPDPVGLRNDPAMIHWSSPVLLDVTIIMYHINRAVQTRRFNIQSLPKI